MRQLEWVSGRSTFISLFVIMDQFFFCKGGNEYIDIKPMLV